MSSQEPLEPVREGDILAGKYRVDQVLGVGGMGVVVAAHHLQLDDRVAIKFLLPGTLGNKDAVARFAQEARAAVKIKSEHVARVTDVGTLENGAPYMVMEYLEGGDLSTWIAQRGALPVEKAVDFLLQACEAIAEAHGLGIVHRDLKPANLFVARLPGGIESVKVLDFGISKLTGMSTSGHQSVTKTSTLMGSPLYMSPEQMQSSKTVDARGDIWALGVILYELIAGVSPFTGDTMPELVLKIMSSPPSPLRNLRPDAPAGLEAVILRCLQKDRSKRYQSVRDLAPALAPFGSARARSSVDRIAQVTRVTGTPASALGLPLSSDAELRPHSQTAGPFGRTTRGSQASRLGLLGAAAGVIVIGAATGVVHVLRSPSSSTSAVAGSTTSPVVSMSARPPEEPPVPPVIPPPDPDLGVLPLDSAKANAPTSTALLPPTAHPATVRPSPQARPAHPPPKKNCDPNFFFDAQGDKHFKPECF